MIIKDILCANCITHDILILTILHRGYHQLSSTAYPIPRANIRNSGLPLY